MFYRISNRIADRFTEKKVIPPEEKELYRFGVQQGLSIALNVVTTLDWYFGWYLRVFCFWQYIFHFVVLQVEFMQKRQIGVMYIRLL